MTQTTLQQWVEEYQDDPEFVAEGLAIDVIEDTLKILTERGRRQSWLAGAMGVSRQSLSRMFNATPNLTLLSIARIAVALDVKPRLILDSDSFYIRPIHDPLNAETVVLDVMNQRSQRLITSTLDTIAENPTEDAIHVATA